MHRRKTFVTNADTKLAPRSVMMTRGSPWRNKIERTKKSSTSTVDPLGRAAVSTYHVRWFTARITQRFPEQEKSEAYQPRSAQKDHREGRNPETSLNLWRRNVCGVYIRDRYVPGKSAVHPFPEKVFSGSFVRLKETKVISSRIAVISGYRMLL